MIVVVCIYEQAYRCFHRKGIHHITFHGDSMSRDLFGEVLEQLGISELTSAQLKALTNTGTQNVKRAHSDA